MVCDQYPIAGLCPRAPLSHLDVSLALGTVVTSTALLLRRQRGSCCGGYRCCCWHAAVPQDVTVTSGKRCGKRRSYKALGGARGRLDLVDLIVGHEKACAELFAFVCQLVPSSNNNNKIKKRKD